MEVVEKQTRITRIGDRVSVPDLSVDKYGRPLSERQTASLERQIFGNGKRTVTRGTEYYQYLKSDEWKSVRRRYLSSDLPKECYCCNAPWQNSFVFHHRTYKNLGRENLRDIVPVCRPCHEAIHASPTTREGRNLWKATKVVRQRRHPQSAHNLKLETNKNEMAGKSTTTQAALRIKQGNFKTPSPKEVEASKTQAGGWTANQLAEWGIAWPPKHGWRKELERKYRERKENGNARSNL